MLERPRRERRGRAGEFRQRLDVLLATDSSARAVAGQLYKRFEGDLSRLPALLQLLEDRWEFPTRVFPLLWVHMRRASGRSEDHGKLISEDEWAVAFDNWLQALRTRCGYSKVSRQCLVHTRYGDDWNKVYLKGAKLGEGSYGEVYLALHASLGVARVVKSVPKSQLSVADGQVEDEVNMLKSLDHPHIVRVFEAFESGESLHIVMDYAEGGDLATAIRECLDSEAMLPQSWVQELSLQVVSALDYMHSRGVIHCDLKPGNTMLLTPFILGDAMAGASKPHALLVDFGLAEIFDETAAVGGPATVKGSPAYLSPEGFDGKLTQKSDTWALGVMLYEMLVGTRPFRGTNNIFVLYCQVANTEPGFDQIPEVPQSLVRALMEKNPASRWSARQCFAHEWFKVQEFDTSLVVPNSLGQQVSYFHRAVTFCMASAMGMKDLKEDYRLFKALDADKSGQLDQEELKLGLAKLGVRQDPSWIMAAMDLDQDGQISYTEFLAATLTLDEERGDRLMRYAFSTFDLDGDGYINMEELRHLLSGDGASVVADVLPDGQTVDEVMEEVSCGDGLISFTRFRSHLTRTKPGKANRMDFRSAPQAHKVADGGGLTSTEEEPEDAADLMNRLDLSESLEEMAGYESDPAMEPVMSRMKSVGGVAEDSMEEMMGFHQWLSDLFRDQQRDWRLTFLLQFRNSRVEAAYVAHYLPATLRQAQVLALLVSGYSVWAVTTEHFQWNPSIVQWTTEVQAVNNLAWMCIFLGSCITFAAVAVWLWRRKKKKAILRLDAGLAAEAAPEDKIQSEQRIKQAAKAEADFDAEAVSAEHMLFAWTIVTPWICCFLANRRRLSAMWGIHPLEVFPAVSSDYDLILTMLGTLMFFSMRTNMTFAHVLPMALSCVLAYTTSSVIMYSMEDEAMEDDNWGWVAALLAVSSALCLSGHRNLEYQRRLAFLSLHASFAVLKDLQVSDADCFLVEGRESLNTTGSFRSGGKGPETRLGRLKKGTQLLQRLSTSAHGTGNPAFRNALKALIDVLVEAREDLAQAERLLAPDVAELLEQKGVDDEAHLKLLELFDELPPVPPLPPQAGRKLEQEGYGSFTAKTEVSDDKEQTEVWGWDVLPSAGPSVKKEMLLSPLAAAGEAILIPAVSRAAGGNDALGRTLMDGLLAAHRSSAPGSEARAALALRAANWLARQIGLWPHLEAWERVALFTAAAGLHCVPVGAVKAMGFKREMFGCLAGEDPLLGHVASSASTMLSLTTAGLAGQGALGGPSPRPGSARSARSVKSTAMDDPNALWRLTRRLQYRARPSRALEDLRRVRVLLDVDDGPLPFGVQSLESTSPEEFEEASAAAKERRLLLAGLVLAAADLAFLALPQRLHQAWAELAADERELGMAARQWLRGLAETLAIPLYDTLRTLEELTHGRGPSNRQPLAVPLHHLRDNARHWTKHMLAPQSKRRSLRSSVAESQTSLRDFLVKSSGDLERDVLRAESTTLPKGAQVPPPPMPDLPGQINEVATWDSDTSRGWDSSSNADLWA